MFRAGISFGKDSVYRYRDTIEHILPVKSNSFWKNVQCTVEESKFPLASTMTTLSQCGHTHQLPLLYHYWLHFPWGVGVGEGEGGGIQTWRKFVTF